MKKLFLTGLMAVIFLAACENKKNDSVSEAEKANEQKMKDSTTMAMMLDKADEEFVVKAAAGGMEEVELGKLANEKGQLKEVKEFGEHMVKQHSMANEELKALAMKKKITIPDSLDMDAKKTKEELMKLKGREFDKKYMNGMVDDHKKDISEFENAANNAKDPEIKAFAEKALPMLREHLQMAQIADSLAKAENKGKKKM